MKLQNFLLAGLLVTGLSACSDKATEGLENGKVKEYDTYLTVNFSSPKYGDQNPHSRTLGPEDKGTTDGQSITKAHIYLLGADGKVAHSIATDVEDGETIEPVRVEVGNYRVFVVTNPGTLVPLKKKGADIQEIIEGVSYDNAKDGFQDGEFLMTTAVNTKDLLDEASPVEIKNSNRKNNPAVVDAKVDRMAVKIMVHPLNVNTEEFLSGEFDTLLTDGGYPIDDSDFLPSYIGCALVNGNESFNLFQIWEESAADPVGKYMNTPQGKLEDVVGGKKMTGYYRPFSEFTEVTMKNGEVDEIKNISDPAMFSTGPFYTVENRPDFILNEKLTAGKAQTTGIIYKIQLGMGADLYYYDGYIYSDKASLKALDAFKGHDFDAMEPEQIRKLGIKVYEEGLMYYTYFIEDQNYKVTHEGNKTKYYAVHRNSVYHLKLEGLTRLGDDVPGGGDITPVNPNPEIDPNEVYLKMDVKINPWVLNTNNFKF